MSVVRTSWKPNLRKCEFQPRPDFVPEEVYKEAVALKRHYNAEWEFWVWNISMEYNVSQAEAEDACIRSIQKEFYKTKLVCVKEYGEDLGNRIATWFEQFMELGDLMRKVDHPIYLPELGYKHGSKPIGAENE